MTVEAFVTFNQVCTRYRVELEIIRDFADFGLYPTVTLDGETGIEEQNLPRLERAISLHQALGINKEGIEVVLGLRERISALEDEVELLRSKVAMLRFSAQDEGVEALMGRGLLIDVDD
jgi:hypothetical protein